MKINLFRVCIVTIGCCLAILLAMALGLHSSVSAGVITILSILDTKRETLRSAIGRLAAFVIATLIAYAAFGLLGYGLLAFGIYLLLFALIVYALHLQAALPICTVLVSHYWLAGHMQPWLMGNEALLMLIGTAIGVALNLLMPRNAAAIRQQQAHLENILRACFLRLSAALDPGAPSREVAQAQAASDMRAFSAALDAANGLMDTLAGNTLLSDITYYQQYMDLRRNQGAILQRMIDTMGDIGALPPQAAEVSRLLWHIAQALGEGSDPDPLLAELDALRERMRTSPLPVTRDEFEARATLYRIMTDAGHFLLLKRSFLDVIGAKERALYQQNKGELL